MSDDLVELELEKLEVIGRCAIRRARRELWDKLHTACVSGRRTGLGTHGLADAMARLKLAYDSDEAIEIIEQDL